MNVVVTGGAGYIGSHAVRELLAAGHRVVVLDNLVKGHRTSIPEETPFVQTDIRDAATLAKTFAVHAIDAVMHFAAVSEVGESMVDPAKYYRDNVAATLSLLESMHAANVRRIVFSSTAAVYGEPKAIPIDESAPKQPTNVYGRTKLIMENVMADYAKAYGLRYIALRYFNACGADGVGDIGEDHQPESHLIPLVLQTCLGKRESIKIFGDDYPTADGTCIRDYVHVNDLATAHILALKALHKGAESAVYNLGNGNGFSVKEIIETAEQVTGITIKKEITPRRAGDPAVLVASSAKIIEELGWSPQYTDLKEVIASAWQWHRQHPNGFVEE